MVVIIKMFNNFSQQKQILQNYISHTLLVMKFPTRKTLYGSINDNTLKQPFSTSILAEDSKLRFIVIYKHYNILFYFLAETAK